jgi:hypothetical protein
VADSRLVHVMLTVTPHADEESVFANMLAQFLARAGNARRDLKHRALEVRHHRTLVRQ